MTSRRSLYFSSPRQVEIREDMLPAPAPDEVLVETLCTAISPGTEMLVYRGEFPDGPADTQIETLRGNFSYPFRYGYACVGRITATGKQINPEWENRLIFSFHPHCSHFLAKPDSLLPIPVGIDPEVASFLPSMETAINLVQDSAPIYGERVMVFGQGIVGLLTASLLAEFPLGALVTADRYGLRREASIALGAKACLDPGESNFYDSASSALNPDADLSIEISGAPAALNDAIALTGYGGRIVVGSWYGKKSIPLDLGGRFHRSRIRILSSQVSTIAPELSGRWDKARRFAAAWTTLERIKPVKWITHRFSLEQAEQAYRMIDESPGIAIQVLLTYP